jgi:hypothetical protein
MTSDDANAHGTDATAATRTDSTASAKAAARKKSQQQKNQKANPPAKKKQAQPQVVESVFEGIASGVSPMEGIVIAQGNGNMSGQFRVFQKKVAGAAADDKAYGLDSAILDLTAKIDSDFILLPKPSPNIHSTLTPVLEVLENGVATGENRLLCFDPVLKEQMDAEYNMDLKLHSSNWNQYQRHEEGFYLTAIGIAEDAVLTYCRMDKRMVQIESNKDLVQFLCLLRSVCAQNNGAIKVDTEFQNLSTLQSAVGFRQKKNISNDRYAEEVADRYDSAIFTCGNFALQSVYDKVLAKYSTPGRF